MPVHIVADPWARGPDIEVRGRHPEPSEDKARVEVTDTTGVLRERRAGDVAVPPDADVIDVTIPATPAGVPDHVLNGPVHILAAQGELDATADHHELTVGSVTGNAVLTTVRRSIDVAHANPRNNLTMNTDNGDIYYSLPTDRKARRKIRAARVRQPSRGASAVLPGRSVAWH
ncbi:MAG: hypothetical protein GEV07_30785 [Streptosporangiales bacterium]|nr:hypothetical protein [Streptosporangiales bacterium]